MIVLGHLSPVMGRDIAEKVLMDIELAKSHDITRELKRLAASGSNGKCKNNIYRDVYKHVLRAPLLVPVLVQFPYRCIGIEGKKWESVLQALLLPHSAMAQLYTTANECWERLFMPSAECIRGFWSDMVNNGNPALVGQSMCSVVDWQRWFIPIWFHGDGVACISLGKAWSKLYDCFSFGSMLVSGKSAQVSFLIWTMFVGLLNRDDDDEELDTCKVFFKVLSWSFQALHDGLWPVSDWCGRPFLAGSSDAKRAGKPLMPASDGNFYRGVSGGMWNHPHPTTHMLLLHMPPQPLEGCDTLCSTRCPMFKHMVSTCVTQR